MTARARTGTGQQVTPGRPRPELDLTSLQHQPRCPGGGITRRDGIETALVGCTGCGATAVVPRRVDWQEEDQ